MGPNLLLAIATVASAELFLRLPFSEVVQRMVLTARKSAALLRSKRISDEWKEKVLPVYAFRIGATSMFAFFLMLACVCPFFLSGLFMQGGLPTLSKRVLSPEVCVGIVILAMGYIWLRKKLSKCRITR